MLLKHGSAKRRNNRYVFLIPLYAQKMYEVCTKLENSICELWVYVFASTALPALIYHGSLAPSDTSCRSVEKYFPLMNDFRLLVLVHAS